MSYLPHTEEEIKEMLSEIGINKIEELFKSVPEEFLLKKELSLPSSMPEFLVEKELKALAERNKHTGKILSFAGGGVYAHYVPRVVDYILSRGEFSTAYTPYQPESSQGTLQAIFEFQTMVCELTGMEVANASMYDGAEASAEAVLMALRVSKKENGKIFVSSTVNPHYREVISTYTKHLNFPVELVGFEKDSGKTDLKKIEQSLKDAVCVVIQHPNYFGVLEDMHLLKELLNGSDVVLVVIVSEALSLSVLEPPGSFGAGIVAGEAQSFGIRPSFGGPLLGFFASRIEWVRKMPGRIVGETEDREGRRGYVLTLATREQHIRRAKATSNICTNHSLMALSATVYLSLLGKKGLNSLAKSNLARAKKLRELLSASRNLELKFNGPVFNEMVINLGKPAKEIWKELASEGIVAGIPVGKYYKELESCLLVATTELTTEEDIEMLVDKLEEKLKR